MSSLTGTKVVKPGSPEDVIATAPGPMKRPEPPRPPRAPAGRPGLHLSGPEPIRALCNCPFLLALYLSLFNWDGVTSLTFAGFTNYEAIWKEPALLAAFAHAAILIIFFAFLPIAMCYCSQPS